MVAMIEESHFKRAFKKVYPNVIYMPRDRDGSFSLIVVPKSKRILLETADTIIMMHAKGNNEVINFCIGDSESSTF